MFLEFYSEFAKQLPQLQLTQTEIECIAKEIVFNDEKFLFHDDVFEVIPGLSATYKLGVVSDTWPSLDRIFVNFNLRNYFSSFVMSSILGVRKPNELMYTTALKELNVNPREAIFVDDNIHNLEGAKKLGIHTIWLLRGYEEVSNGDYKSIKDLFELEETIKKLID
ncbi:Alpha-D-glucose-1-phosphate phosphatase YihX [compost metagenome]